MTKQIWFTSATCVAMCLDISGATPMTAPQEMVYNPRRGQPP
jgi:hypothetical protein